MYIQLSMMDNYIICCSVDVMSLIVKCLDLERLQKINKICKNPVEVWSRFSHIDVGRS